MGRFSKHWTFWARLVWMFTGKAPESVDLAAVLEAEMAQLQMRELETQLEVIREQHHAASLKAQAEFIQAWKTRA